MPRPYTYAKFKRDFRAGKEFWFGTWADLYKVTFHVRRIPAECPKYWTPRECSYEEVAKHLEIKPFDFYLKQPTLI